MGMSLWVIGVIVIGFSGYLGDLRLIIGCFMGFGLDLWVWGRRKVIHEFYGIFGGFFRGLRVGLLLINAILVMNMLNCNFDNY